MKRILKVEDQAAVTQILFWLKRAYPELEKTLKYHTKSASIVIDDKYSPWFIEAVKSDAFEYLGRYTRFKHIFDEEN